MALYGLFQSLLDSDQYTEAALLIWGQDLFDPRPKSVQRIWSALMREPKVLIPGGGSLGKCLKKGTKVVMFGGSIRAVEDVCIQDELTGDDSTARKVLDVTSGFGRLFEVTPARGRPWVCNENHILSLKSSRHELDVVDIPVQEFISSSEAFRGLYKQYRAGSSECTSISVKEVEPGEYCGFSLDGNHRFLLEDFTVTHNSYTPAAWAVLNWVRDPMYTSGKIISVTEGHAGANMMATIKTFHESSALKLPGQRMDRGINLGSGDRRASIWMMALPPGDDGKGRLRGFHPVRRPKPHPQFGHKTRLFALIDEGEDAPHGLWEGLENMLSTEGKQGEVNLITIASGANPKKRESPYGQRAEPPGGWETFDIETSQEWYGPEKLGRWFVCRLDPAKSENVVERREVYPGMMTYEGYMNYYKQGTNSSPYLTFGRGAWPTGTTEFYIVPQSFFNNSVGIYTFSGMPVAVATLDPAFAEGGDMPIMTAGRYGVVIGFTPFGGTLQKFSKPFNGLQIEQQFSIRKDNTLVMADEVANYLRELKVRPEFFAVDMTGNGLGIHDALKIKYGDILGIQWSEAATDKRILDEDTLTAEQRFSGVNTEMMFAFSTWLQYGYIKFAPMMATSKLISQATGRKYLYGGKGLIKAQSKIDFKNETGGQSPDEFDSAIMLPHLIRVRRAQNAAMLPDIVAARSRRESPTWGEGQSLEEVEYYEDA